MSAIAAAMPRKRAVRRSNAMLYAALAVLLVIASIFYARSLALWCPQWFGITGAQWPFLLFAEGGPHFKADFIWPSAHAAGMREGDWLIAINGVPTTSLSVYAGALSASHPGDTMNVTFQRDSEQTERHARIRLGKLAGPSLWIQIFVPGLAAFCLLLGFWVAAVRPRDVRAWLLLGLMLAVAGFFNSYAEFWSPPLRIPGVMYRAFQQFSWFAWLFLLGIYFPEPFSGRGYSKWWRWLVWTVVSVWAIFLAIEMCVSAIELYSLDAALPLSRFLVQSQDVREFLIVVMVGGFLFSIGAKYRMALSADARRRLRVLYAGAAVSLLPVLLLFAAADVKGSSPELLFPPWLYMSTYVAFALLPVTLAYVIVVQRAMDVRVVIRQGLQYALARRGVLVLQALLSAALFIAVAILLTSHKLSPLATVLSLAAGLCGIFLLYGTAQRAAVWIDKRFFRDAYNAEQILSDLAERVRTMVETQPLLETVAGRIADSLHVRHVAVLLDGSGTYRPAHALGYGSMPDAVFEDSAATIKVLKAEKQPVRIYFEDADSWIYRSAEISDEERAQLAVLRPELLLPISVRDELLGFMSLGPKLSEAPYSGTDLRLLNSVASQTGLALEVARLSTEIASETAHRERLNRELEIAREVQEHLFPQLLPAICGLDYCGCCRPAREVGGDYYDFIELPEGMFGIAIGDVSGKGIGASLMMASLQASLRGQASLRQSLPEMMARINNLVYRASSANRYATFFYAEYDPQSRQLIYVNAGHNPPLVLRESNASCEVYRLEAGGMVIGLMPESRYEQGSFALEAGDLLVLFTDGVSESMNAGDEEWGEERLIEFAKTCLRLPPAEAMNRIMSAAQAFAAGAPQHDDMTVVTVRVQA